MRNRKLKILIAEDELIIALALKTMLEDEGHEVTSLVSTALEAITRSQIDKPDLILMDVLLSGSLNGFEAARIISYKGKTPIIFLTGNTDEEFLFSLKNVSNYGFLQKPFDKKQVIDMIEKNIISIQYQTDSLDSVPPSSYTY